VRVAVDAGTHLLSDVSLELHPPGAPPDFTVRVEGSFSPEALAAADPAGRFDPAGRTAVASLSDLGSDRLAPGSGAPDLVLPDLEGRRVALRDLRGRVVVLDLWATWCIPCWKALRHAQDLAAWARAEGLPVTVLAVDTLEELPAPAERRDRAAAFCRSQGLSLDVLLDSDDAAFRALGHPGLPSLVVIDRAGLVSAVHTGALATPEATLRAAVREALDRAAPAP
jgi:peroxiredoxin